MAYPNLEAELSRAGVSRVQVAELLGKNKSTISIWMGGGRGGFSVKQARRIREAFFPDMSLDYLFAETPILAELKEARCS